MKRLVVARFQEDTGWTAHLPGWTVQIVQKDADLPNRGREPSSFLWAILHDQIDPDGLYAFVQGNPMDHYPHLFSRLAEPVDGFVPLGEWHLTTDGNGAPHHNGVPVAECYESWLGQTFPGEVEFWAGGQFAATGKQLLSRPREFYQRVYDDLMTFDGLVPYAAERLWPSMFA